MLFCVLQQLGDFSKAGNLADSAARTKDRLGLLYATALSGIEEPDALEKRGVKREQRDGKRGRQMVGYPGKAGGGSGP